MIIFKKARSPKQTLNDLDSYLQSVGTEPIKLLARSVQSWGEISYDELADLIADGRLDDYLDWQARYSALIAGTLAPLWSDAITAASRKATAGKVVLYDSNDYVRAWIENRGGELISMLSRESQKAVAMVILLGQSNRMASRDIAKQVRPLIGLNERQAAANLNYREKVYNKYREQGMGEVKARERADKAAIKYAGKQHRFRAETIVHTELAFAYNRGAHMGVGQAIAEGYMGRCAMKWSTAGTNRVCSRCLALKDTIVGYTDESGVTLPPLHPRCRCAIIYDEVAAPRRIDNKPKNPLGDRNYNSEFAKTIGKEHYDKIRDILESAPNQKAAQLFAKHEGKIRMNLTDAGNSAYHKDGKISIDLSYHSKGDSISKPYQIVFHETGHLIDYLARQRTVYFSEGYKGGAFYKAIHTDFNSLLDSAIVDGLTEKAIQKEIRQLIKAKNYYALKQAGFITRDEFIMLSKTLTPASEKKAFLKELPKNIDYAGVVTQRKLNKIKDEIISKCNEQARADLSDIFSGLTYNRIEFGAAHDIDYWRRYGDNFIPVSREAFAEFMDSAIANAESYALLKEYLPTASKVFEGMLDELLKVGA